MLIALVTWRGLPELAPDDRLLRDALLRRGVDARAAVWDDASVEWPAFDAIVVRSTWDYHKRIDEFRAWLASMDGLPLWNPPSVLRWNTHKSYLLELQTAEDDLLVQPFVPEVVSAGELSFVFLGKRFSHAVRKRPGHGDFRVQTEFGGSVERFTPCADFVAQAEGIAAALGDEWLYARIDCVARDGRLILMELEATEPSLFLDAESAERFADAIVSRA